MAFNFLHRRRHKRFLTRPALRTLAALLDFGASTNAVLDHKRQRPDELGASFHMLKQGARSPCVNQYVHRLVELERGRPMPLGDDAQHQKVRTYREDVVRLSLGMLATTAGLCGSLEEGIDATRSEDDLNLLFRMVMLCQIIDDVLDYSADLCAALPSFLTGAFSLPRAFELTHFSARGYGDIRHRPVAADLFPLRVALVLISHLTKGLIALTRSRPLALAPSTGP
jgi:hypothetical protein